MLTSARIAYQKSIDKEVDKGIQAIEAKELQETMTLELIKRIDDPNYKEKDYTFERTKEDPEVWRIALLGLEAAAKKEKYLTDSRRYGNPTEYKLTISWDLSQK